MNPYRNTGIGDVAVTGKGSEICKQNLLTGVVELLCAQIAPFYDFRILFNNFN
jgi:hypothetical protein